MKSAVLGGHSLRNIRFCAYALQGASFQQTMVRKIRGTKRIGNQISLSGMQGKLCAAGQPAQRYAT